MTQESVQTARIGPNDILRFVLELFAIFSLCFWGFVDWPGPWLNVVVGIGAPLLAVLLWALFRSPKAVFRIDAFGKALVEIVVLASVVFAWWLLGQPAIAACFGIVAIISGIISGRKDLA